MRTRKSASEIYWPLKRKSFHVETYDPNKQSASKAEENEGKKCKQEMLEFIEIKGKECKEEMFKFIESIMIRHVNSVLFPRKKWYAMNKRMKVRDLFAIGTEHEWRHLLLDMPTT